MNTTVVQDDDTLFAPWQQTTLIIIPYVTGPISMASSSLMVYLIARHWKRKKHFLYHRLLLAMSVCDAVGSINASLSGLVIPREFHRFASRGNMATCEASGFLLQLSASMPLLNMFLCIYYMRVVCFGWVPPTSSSSSSSKGKWGWFEISAYLIAIVYPLAMGGVGILYDSFSPMATLPGWCYFSEMPYDCNKFDDVECIRGENYSFIQLFASTIPLLCSVILGVVSVSMITRKVRRQQALMTTRYGISTSTVGQSQDFQDNSTIDNASTSHSTIRWLGGHESKNCCCPRWRSVHTSSETVNLGNMDNRMEQTAQQARLYAASFFITYMVPITQGFTGAFLTADRDNRAFFFVTGILITVLTPLQGLWNLMIYIRPQYRQLRLRNPASHWWVIFYRTLSSAIVGHPPEIRSRTRSIDNETHSESWPHRLWHTVQRKCGGRSIVQVPAPNTSLSLPANASEEGKQDKSYLAKSFSVPSEFEMVSTPNNESDSHAVSTAISIEFNNNTAASSVDNDESYRESNKCFCFDAS
uniref:Uncharacterized protein n=1 Tax=Amphora coffeiformis TaxID=265554 RepID=A0A6S8J521_9STRA